MRVLVLGGTQFVGRSFVEEALAAGHEVTLFNRGKTRPDLFPEAERIRGDRGEDLSALAGRSWDAVFDPSCYVPRLARMSAEALGDAAPHYTFVSTLSVYADETVTGQDETGRLATIDDPATEDITGETYGALKVLAENEIGRVYGDRALIVRPGYICGPYDNLDRMPYWLRRVARGGEVLAPESPGFPVQLIDARDIARFALAMAERGAGGVFNLCAPQEPFAFGDLLDAAARATFASRGPRASSCSRAACTSGRRFRGGSRHPRSRSPASTHRGRWRRDSRSGRSRRASATAGHGTSRARTSRCGATSACRPNGRRSSSTPGARGRAEGPA